MAKITISTLPGAPGVTVAGRLNRKDTHPFLLNIPAALKQRLGTNVKAGAHGTALLGLIQYALDDLDNKKEALHVEVD